MEQTQELIDGVQKGLLQWYDFKEESRVLYIGDENTPLVQMLLGKELCVICVQPKELSDEEWRQKYDKYFDYIICIQALEMQKNPTEYLEIFHRLLKIEGIMLLGMNNRMGIRYFCGDRDIYTNRCFDGIEGYRRAYTKKEDVFKGRCYNKAELNRMLTITGWERFCFYSVFSDLTNPSLIYSENYLPNEDLANRLLPFYNYPHTVFINERTLYEDLVNNGLFHQMANAYLIECTINGKLSDIDHVTCSMDRGKERALFTIIRHSGTVEKRAAYQEGRKRLACFIEHARDLKNHGIAVVDAQIKNDTYVMPYVKGEVAQLYLKRLIRTDINRFFQELDYFRDLILQSSDIVKEDMGDGEGAILRRGYLDMVPLNSFHLNGTFVFYDQEFCEENYPANAIIARMITTLYSGNWELDKIMPIEELFSRYHLTKNLTHWLEMERIFLSNLVNAEKLRIYYGRHRIGDESIHSNSQRINCSESEYRKIFIDIFKDTDNRKLILFGSGNFTKKFLALYEKDYPVYAIIDNNADRWGEKMNGIAIQSPEILKQLSCDTYKVIVCIKNYASVISQLESMGVTQYSIYDANIGYGRKTREYVIQKDSEAAPKKYHVGYISGVFDLFHIGHLNMFKRAKEQCDYLIVGVVTDEGVRSIKRVEPFVPFAERIEMVRSCRYVDEAVEIPLQYNDTREAYKLYHFDCQFSGSDYRDNLAWLSNKEFLEQNGSTMVFFPYTESTSSSKIKELIEKRLM